jgi:hypothetical protein
MRIKHTNLETKRTITFNQTESLCIYESLKVTLKTISLTKLAVMFDSNNGDIKELTSQEKMVSRLMKQFEYTPKSTSSPKKEHMRNSVPEEAA